MTDIICTSEQEYRETYDRLLAERNRKIGRRCRNGAPADYVITVEDDDGMPCFSVAPRVGSSMDQRETGLFLTHIATAERAMRVGASYFVAVYFDDGEIDLNTDN